MQQTSVSSLELNCIVVHANGKHNPDHAGIMQLQHLLDALPDGHIYEHKAYHDSLVEHNGHRIDNEKNPGYYIIPDLDGNSFIIAGGGIGCCHYGAYLAVLSQMYNKKKSIHLPLDCIYDTVQENGELVSSSVSMHHPKLHNYTSLVKLVNDHFAIFKDGKCETETSGSYQTNLYFWSSHQDMLAFLDKHYL